MIGLNYSATREPCCTTDGATWTRGPSQPRDRDAWRNAKLRQSDHLSTSGAIGSASASARSLRHCATRQEARIGEERRVRRSLTGTLARIAAAKHIVFSIATTWTLVKRIGITCSSRVAFPSFLLAIHCN